MVVHIAPEGAVSPISGLMALAAAFKTSLANCKLRLFKDTILDVDADTTLATLVAAEADFSGYTAGGVTVTAVNDPVFEAPDAAVVYSPLTQFNYDSGVGVVANNIGGFFVVSAAGDLILAKRFAESVAINNDNAGLPIVFGKRFNNAIAE